MYPHSVGVPPRDRRLGCSKGVGSSDVCGVLLSLHAARHPPHPRKNRTVKKAGLIVRGNAPSFTGNRVASRERVCGSHARGGTGSLDYAGIPRTRRTHCDARDGEVTTPHALARVRPGDSRERGDNPHRTPLTQSW